MCFSLFLINYKYQLENHLSRRLTLFSFFFTFYVSNLRLSLHPLEEACSHTFKFSFAERWGTTLKRSEHTESIYTPVRHEFNWSIQHTKLYNVRIKNTRKSKIKLAYNMGMLQIYRFFKQVFACIVDKQQSSPIS